MRYFEIVTRKHYRHEPYHDVSGYELEIVRTGGELPTWEDEAELKAQAEKVRNAMIEGLKEYNHLPKIEEVNENTIRVVDWFSIGD